MNYELFMNINIVECVHISWLQNITILDLQLEFEFLKFLLEVQFEQLVSKIVLQG
jgi:hypothetical protein